MPLTNARGDILLPRAIPTFRTGHLAYYPAVLRQAYYPAGDITITGYAWPTDGDHPGALFCYSRRDLALARAEDAARLLSEGVSPYDAYPEYQRDRAARHAAGGAG